MHRVIRGLFSERHEESSPKTLEVFDNKTIVDAVNILSHNLINYTDTFWTGRTYRPKEAFFSRINTMKTDNAVVNDYNQVYAWLRNGQLNAFFDIIELACVTLDDYDKENSRYGEHLSTLVEDINNLFEVRKKSFKLDVVEKNGKKEYQIRKRFEDQQQNLIDKAIEDSRLIGDNSYQEYSDAIREFTRGNYEGAIQYCNTALESALCKALNVKEGKLGELYKKFCTASDVPGVVSENSRNLINVIAGLAGTATKKHGGDQEIKQLSKQEYEGLAEVTIGFTATILSFVRKKGLKVQENSNDAPSSTASISPVPPA